MSYRVDYGELDALMGAYNSAISQWRAGISSVMGQVGSVKASTNISGNSADRLREYLDLTYSCANAMLSMLLDMFQQSFLLYTEAYRQQVDASGETHIDEEELSERRISLQGKRSQLQQIALAAENSVKGISDLVVLPSLDIGAADAEFGTILNSLDNLDAAVNGVESAYSSGGIAEINELLSNSTAFLKEMCQQSEDFKTTFTAASFAGLASVPGMLASMNKADAWLSANESDVAVAVEHLEERLAIQQAEYEKREKLATAFKIVTYAAVAIGSAALIAAFPAASPVVIGMASGLITSSVSASADEYVKHGFNVNQWDKGRIGAHACIGTVTGMVGGAVGSEAGVFVKAGVKGLSGALEGAATTSYDQLATYGSITDAKAVLTDAAVKGGSSFAGSLVGGAIAKNVKTIGISSLDLAKDDPLSKMHGLSVFLYEGGKSMGTGVISRGVSNITGQVISLSSDGTVANLNEIDLISVKDDMFSVESMGQDFVVSGASGAVSDYVELRTPDPDTGLTPIIQYKLGNTTDPETGLTPIVQDSLSHIVDEDEFSDILRGMEERNPSTGSAAVGEVSPNGWEPQEDGDNSRLADWNDIDWQNTSNTSAELRQIEEMERRGEFEIDGKDYSSVKASTDFEEAQYPSMRTPSGKQGTWLGDPGNSGYIPDDPEAQAVMREYGQDRVMVHDKNPDFKPFSQHDTPWGKQDCEVEIGHMTSQRTGTDGNYDQADEALAKRIGGGVSAENIRQYRKESGLTWHEVEDGKTMQLIPTVINDSVGHTGGTAVSKYGQKMGDISHYYE